MLSKFNKSIRYTLTMKKILLIALVLVCVQMTIPHVASAVAPGGFVTCDGPDCSACNLVEMTNVIIRWLFGIIFVIFAALMMTAGFGLVTSGGSQSALEAAKSKFTNAIIGIIIVMSAWLIVDTVMKGLLEGGTGVIAGWGPWSEVQCFPMTESIPFVDNNTGQGGGTPGNGTGPGQVPGSTVPGTCAVPPLTVITDPLAIQMEQGQTLIYKNGNNLRQCAEKFIGMVGGGARINSAYRPASYQTHLFEIKDRWCTKGLRANSDLACRDLKTAIGSEVTKHFGNGWSCGAVGKTSLHTQGTAVDIGGIPSHSAPNVQAAAAASCLIWKNYSYDPVHYDLKSNCTNTCN